MVCVLTHPHLFKNQETANRDLEELVAWRSHQCHLLLRAVLLATLFSLVRGGATENEESEEGSSIVSSSSQSCHLLTFSLL